MSAMKVRILAFAALRDRLGFCEKTVDLADGASVSDAAVLVFGGEPPRGLAYAVNEQYTATDRVLSDGDEVAILPPVAGGLPLLRVQADPIDVPALRAQVGDPGCGAVLVFEGTAREVAGETLVSLEYEAYGPMAERFFAEVADEIQEQHGVDRLAIVHRTGSVALGEPSIAIVVASPHRAAGFAALRHAIERIKDKAPIWKKEVTEKRAHWVRSEEID